jgi:HEAT repeat protein
MISWEAGLLLALLGTAALLFLTLLACNRRHRRMAARAAALEREVTRMLAVWAVRSPSQDEVDRLSGLGASDRRAVLGGLLGKLPEAPGAAAERARDALRRSRLLDHEVARLRHRSGPDRAEACRVLGRLGESEAIPLLVERLRDHDALVRREAIGALGDLGAAEAMGEVVEAIEAAGDWGNLLAVMALVRMGQGTLPRIGALLGSSRSAAMTKALLQVTGQLRAVDDPALPRSLAAHPDPQVRVEALRTLGTLGPDPASVAVCLRAMDDPEWPVRALAAWSLGRLGDGSAVSRLRQAMGDTAYWVRHHVAGAMAALGETGETALVDAVDDANPFVRDMAAQALYLRAATRGEAA